MEITILGSGGCMVIPKPLCRCRICREAREKGGPYQRTGPSIFIHDENILIDTPAEIIHQLNRSGIEQIDHLLFTHLDPDHVEGFRVVEQAALDFRSWKAYEDKAIRLTLPEELFEGLRRLCSIYGPLIDFYRDQGFLHCVSFRERVDLGRVKITALPVDRGNQKAFVYVFEKDGRKMVYAPCDIKPFPESRKEVRNPDLLIIQPGIFESGLKHGFEYPDNHISRSTLYTFEQTMELAGRIEAKEILFAHLEEYWNRGLDDYRDLEKQFANIRFAYDGMRLQL